MKKDKIISKFMFNQKSLILFFSILLLNHSVFTTSNKLLANEGTNKEQNNLSVYHGFPLSCYLKNGLKGVYNDSVPTTIIMTDQAAQWSEIILNYAEIGNWTEVNQLIPKMEDDLTKEKTLVALITKRAIKGEFKEAENFAKQIKTYPSYIAQGRARLGHYYLLANNPEKSSKMFQQALNLLKEIDKDYAEIVKNDVYSLIAVEYWLAGKEKQANQLLKLINDNNEIAKFWSEIAKQLAIIKEFDQALNAVDNINIIRGNDEYNLIDSYRGEALSKLAEYATTEQLSLLVNKVNQISELTYKNAALAEIIKRYIQSEDYEQADFLIKELNDTNGDLLTYLVYEYAKKGKIDTATTLNNLINNEYWQNQSTIKILEGLTINGQDEQALTMAKQLTILEQQLPALISIAEGYIETKQYQLALNLLVELNKITTEELNKNQELDQKYLVLTDINGTSNYLISMVKCTISTIN